MLPGLFCMSGVYSGPPARSVDRRRSPDRDFYVILAGVLVVDVDDTVTRGLGSGDFFGELAAKDWGSGFGYPRLASTPPNRRSAVADPARGVRELLATEPMLHAAVQRAVHERLPVS